MPLINPSTGDARLKPPVLDRILIVDDHPIFSDGLASLLQREGLAGHVDHASCVTRALECLAAQPGTDLILLDLRLPGVGGLGLIPQLDQAGLPIPVVVISSAEDESTLRAVRSAGVQGFMPKSAGRDQLVSMVNTIAGGERYFPASAVVQAPPNKLTPRQQDVLALLAEGLPNKRICQVLDLTEHTVKTHLKAVFQQLGVHNRTECVALARSLGLVNSDRLGVLESQQDGPQA